MGYRSGPCERGLGKAPCPRRRCSPMMWYWGTGAPWWGWLLGCFGMVMFLGLVILGIWYVVTHAVPGSESPQPDGARAVLDNRLARGEVDTDEYARLRDAITSTEAHIGNGRAR